MIVAHDLAIVREVCSDVTVMYLGRIAEAGVARPLFREPAHPYSQALLSAVPSPDPRIEADRRRIILAGDPPSPSNPPPGCRFNTRCPVAMDICRLDEPQLRPVPHGGVAACHLAESDHRPVIWTTNGSWSSENNVKRRLRASDLAATGLDWPTTTLARRGGRSGRAIRVRV
ncbi:ABC transporter ATP-binding protein [Mesorhizobium sp. M0184]|uniref:ABC transporter ATP-binding protein n=2 Tax=unclassified Mesorhizobium TaxID=325217 RepID=UPI00333759D5